MAPERRAGVLKARASFMQCNSAPTVQRPLSLVRLRTKSETRSHEVGRFPRDTKSWHGSVLTTSLCIADWPTNTASSSPSKARPRENGL